MQTNTNQSMIKEEYGASYKRMFWPMMAVFYALFVLRNVFSVNFPVALFLAWVAVMALVFDETEIKALLIAFMPLAPGFQSKFAILVCMVILLCKCYKNLKVPFFVLIVPLLMVWEYFHLSIGYSSTAEYLSGFAPLMCLVLIVSLPNKHEDISFFSRVLAVTLAVASVILMASMVLGDQQSLSSLFQEGIRLGTIEEAEDYQITYNANGLGFLCNIAIVGLLTNFYFKRSKKIDYVLMVLLIVVGCLTVSRTFLLCLAGTFVLYVLLQQKSLFGKIRVLITVSFCVAIGFGLLKLTVPTVIENYVTRFNAEDITGGRSFLYDFYNEFITSSPERLWFGIGVQSIDLKMMHFTGAQVNVPHNGYQQMIVAWGIIGLALMLLLILFMTVYARKKNRGAPFMCYLPLILLMVNILAGQFVTSGTKLLSLIFIYLMICNGGKKAVKESNGTDQCK